LGHIKHAAVAQHFGIALGELGGLVEIGLALGRVDFSNLFLVLREGAQPGPYATVEAAAKAAAVTLNYGVFFNTMISFVIVAWAVFLLIKAMNRLKREEPAAASAAPPEPPEDVKLLREIRDLLKSR